MSLQLAAKDLANKGRGNDSMLVHMTPGEVKGLQALALAHGGSLTINPTTGLPEAGFLEKILPMVAGAALSFIPGVGPFAAAALVGGGYGLATGSVEKGLMAGLGAYGGAGIASSLAGIGSEAARTAGEQAAVEGFKKTSAEAVKSGLTDVSAEAAKTAAAEGFNLPANYADLYAKTGGVQDITTRATQDYISNANNLQGLTTTQRLEAAKSVPDLVSKGSSPEQIIGSLGRASTAQLAPGAPGAVTGTNVLTGLKEVGTSLPAAGQFVSSNVGTLGSAALPFLMQDQKGAAMPGYQEDEYDERLKRYRLSPNYQAYEAPRPNPYYQAQYPTYAAEGGIMKLQNGGGPVERMSMMNTAMNPQGGLYPQGMIDKTQYATPIQRPVSSEMVMEDSAYERSNPMLMAAGGEVKGYAAGGKTMLPQFQGSRLEGDNIVDASGRRIGTIGMAAPTPTPQQDFVNPRGTMSPEMQAYYAQDFANQRARDERMQGLLGPQLAVQPTGQSTFPGAASMQSGFGQGAQGYPSFTMGSGSFGGGTGGAFPLEGRYGIVKMAPGGIARYASRGQVNVLQDYLDRQEAQQQRMGPLPESVGVPRTGIYRDTDIDTARKDALTAAMIRLGKASKAAGIKTAALPKTSIKGLGDISGATQDTTEAARGGVMSHLGGYSDGGRMLKGPGDGMSDSIPATIAGKQPARLADGEFVVPADVVSHLGNGSTDAGAKKLYGMMDRIRKARTGKKKQAPAVKANRYMPA